MLRGVFHYNTFCMCWTHVLVWNLEQKNCQTVFFNSIRVKIGNKILGFGIVHHWWLMHNWATEHDNNVIWGREDQEQSLWLINSLNQSIGGLLMDG